MTQWNDKYLDIVEVGSLHILAAHSYYTLDQLLLGLQGVDQIASRSLRFALFFFFFACKKYSILSNMICLLM